MTGCYTWGKQPGEHPFLANSDKSVGPSSEIIQSAIEMKTKYQLNLQTEPSGSTNFDTINQSSTITDSEVGPEIITSCVLKFNSTFICILAIVIAMNTTNPPKKPHKNKDCLNDVILDAIKNNVKILHTHFNLSCGHTVDQLAAYNLTSYYRMFNTLQTKASKAIISSWQDKPGHGTPYIFAHQYGVVAPLVYFPKTNMVGEKTESFIDSKTNLFIPNGKQMANGEGMNEEAQRNTVSGGQAVDLVVMKESKDNESMEAGSDESKDMAMKESVTYC